MNKEKSGWTSNIKYYFRITNSQQVYTQQFPCLFDRHGENLYGGSHLYI